jgi:hypothetical protein
MKFECGKVSRHDRLMAVLYAVISALAATRIGTHYGWSGKNPGVIDDFGVAFAIVGFLVALLCVVSVPMNNVNTARLGVGAIFVSYAYLAAFAAPGLSVIDRAVSCALYLMVSYTAVAEIIRRDAPKDIKDVEKDIKDAEGKL